MKLEVFWHQLVGMGAEHLVLSTNGAIHADGLAVGEISGGAYRIHYQIDCDPGWNVLGLRIEDLLGAARPRGFPRGPHGQGGFSESPEVYLTRTPDDRWMDADGTMLDALDGCIDVDLIFTPFTNTLPIRRLNLKPGEAREIAVVYVGLPGLKVSRFRQRYTCLSSGADGGIYRYESVESGFTAELKVDGDGLVMDYPSIFVMHSQRRLPD